MSQFDDSSPSGRLNTESFLTTLAANVNSSEMGANEFRELVRNLLPLVRRQGQSSREMQSDSSLCDPSYGSGSQFDGPYPQR